MGRISRSCLLTLALVAFGCDSNGAKVDGASSKPASSSASSTQKSSDVKAPSAPTASTGAAPAGSPASADAAPAVVVSATDLAKDGASLEFAEFSKKYAGKRLEVTGKLKDERGDLVLEAAPKNVFLAFGANDGDAVKALIGKTATLECGYGGTANKAVNLKDCKLKR